MPFARPSLTELRQQVAADILAGLEEDTLLRFSNLGILGDATAALTEGLYEYLDWIALQAVPFTATGEYLDAWAAFKGMTRKPASAASVSVSFTGTTGSIVPAGTPLVRSDGAEFTTTATATLAGGTATATAVASVAGSAGTMDAGSTLTLGTGISGINASATVVAQVAAGTDVETTAAFRARMLAEYASPPQGGAASDYVEWALGVPGVTRAWVTRNGMGTGTVTVYFMMDDAEAAHGGFPQGTNGVAAAEDRDIAATGDQLTVANAIYDLQPVTALVYAVAPGQNVLNFTIAGLSTATAATKGAVTAAIMSALMVGASTGGTTNLSVIENAIAAIPAAAGFVITAITASAGTVTPGVAGNIVSNSGYLATLGTVTFA